MEEKAEGPLQTAGGIGSAKTLMGAEEHVFMKAHNELRENMVAHYKDMDTRGCLNKYEKNLLRSGVLFKPIKLAIYGMRPDEIREKELYMKEGQGLSARPSSGTSLRSQKSTRSISSLGRAPPRKANDDIAAGNQPRK